MRDFLRKLFLIVDLNLCIPESFMPNTEDATEYCYLAIVTNLSFDFSCVEFD